MNLKKNNPSCNITLISFEKNLRTVSIKEIPDSINVIIFKQYPFFGGWSLFYYINQIHRYLKKFKNFSIIARGPIAGFICKYAAKKTDCKQLTIQARGLLAEEYGYTHQQCNRLIKPFHALRKKMFEQLEKSVYSNQNNTPFPLIIESVSYALQDYLIEQFNANPEQTSVATRDIPITIGLSVRLSWRKQIRKQLQIPDGAFVYVYNGSAKAWQCPDEIISFFEHTMQEKPNALLLILSQDEQIFKNKLIESAIPDTNYRILHVPHHIIYEYLAAADTGLLFRKPHIINWISRPTKALEYQAVSLPIIHNNTVSYLLSQ